MKKIFLVNKGNIVKDCDYLANSYPKEILHCISSKIQKGVDDVSFNNDKYEVVISKINEIGLNKTHIIVISEMNNVSDHEDKLRFLGELSTNLFHELRSPLNILISSIELLKMEINEVSAEELKPIVEERVGHCEMGVLKIFNIMKGIQNFAQGKHEYKQVNVLQFLEDTIAFSEMFLKDNKISIKLDKGNLSSSLKSSIQESLIAQVLVNLIKNSSDVIKKLPQFNRWIVVSVSETDGFFTVSVTDSGSGISTENQKKLFSYGFTTKPVGEGFGIGLNFCRKVIEQHNGSLKYDADSKNTRFYFTLPKNS